MRIAIVDFQGYEDLKITLDQLHFIDKDVIDAKIDLFCDDVVALDTRLQEHKFIHKIYPIKTNDISILTLKGKYKSLRYYTRLNRYHIAIDTQYSFLSAICTYILAGKTAGFYNSGLKNYFINKLYDETMQEGDKKKESIYALFSKTFGFENEFFVEV